MTVLAPMPEGSFDLVGEIMAYEDDYATEYEDNPDARMIRLFQHLVNTGQAWSLQGSYGRMAAYLIEAGLVTRPGGPTNV